MIPNPTPNTHRIRKLRNGKYILVSKGILRRRKLLRKGLVEIQPTIDDKQKLGRPKKTRHDRLMKNYFG